VNVATIDELTLPNNTFRNCTDSKNLQNSLIVRPCVLNLQEAGWW